MDFVLAKNNCHDNADRRWKYDDKQRLVGEESKLCLLQKPGETHVDVIKCIDPEMDQKNMYRYQKWTLEKI